MNNLLWFSEIGKDDLEICGEKAVSLAELYNIGMPIPQGFVVTSNAYQKFLQENNINKQIQNILSNLNLDDLKLLQKKSEEIQEIILKAEIPEELKEEIYESYENLNVDNEVLKSGNKNALSLIKLGRSLPYVAVRSIKISGGDFPTFLSVKGNNSLSLSIKKCWASLFTSSLIYKREKNNIEYNKILISVIIQRMINSESSGIIFTINPLTHNENELMIESTYGLSELIIANNINSNIYIIDKQNNEIKSKKTPKQDYMVIREETLNKNLKRKVPEDMKEQVLDEQQILQLVDYGKKIEQFYNKAVDIEYAIESGKMNILQVKPLRTIKMFYGKKENV